MQNVNVEICCGSIQSAANARAAGATRIELCQNLNQGGTTPSYATMRQCVEDMHLDVFVLVRPRPGNFVYNSLEIDNMARDVQVCKDCGVAGIVVGFLHPDGRVDKELTRRFVELAAPLPVTFHRAFDRCPDWRQVLEDVIDCGCKRILTSGCKPTAEEGRDTLRELVRLAGERITILMGGGVRSGNVRELIDSTGVREVHGSCKTLMPNGSEETDSAEVVRLLEACRQEWNNIKMV